MTSRAVCYAITNNEPFLSMAKNSIASLRARNSQIPVYLFAFGSLSAADQIFFKKHNILLKKQRPLRKGVYRYSLKWQILKNLKEERILFCDADTEFSDDVEHLFQRYQTAHFYARREIGSMKRRHRIGSRKEWRQIDHEIMGEIFRKIRAKETPVFNSGVMLFNRFSHQKIDPQKIQARYEQLIHGEWPYPSPNHFIRDQIAFTLTISKIRGFKWGTFRKKAVPFYLELRERDVSAPGVLTHVMTAFYPEFKNSSN